MKNNLIVGIIIGFILGAGLFYFYNNSYKGNTYVSGWQAAQKRLLETTPMYKVLENQDVKSVAGMVKSVSGNVISVKISPVEPLADPSLDVRDITIENNTKIIIATLKTRDALQKEIEDYQKEMQKVAKDGKGQMPNMPDQFIKTNGTKGDIIASSTVTVVAYGDIKRSKSFPAVEIMIQK